MTPEQITHEANLLEGIIQHGCDAEAWLKRRSLSGSDLQAVVDEVQIRRAKRLQPKLEEDLHGMRDAAVGWLSTHANHVGAFLIIVTDKHGTISIHETTSQSGLDDETKRIDRALGVAMVLAAREINDKCGLPKAEVLSRDDLDFVRHES